MDSCACQSRHNAIVKPVRPIAAICTSVHPSNPPTRQPTTPPGCYVACNTISCRKKIHLATKITKCSPNCVFFLLRCASRVSAKGCTQWEWEVVGKGGSALEFAHELKCKQKQNEREKQKHSQHSQPERGYHVSHWRGSSSICKMAAKCR